MAALDRLQVRPSQADPAVIPLARYSVSYDGRREVFLVRSLEEIPLCPSCGRRLRPFGYRLRHVIADDGLARWYELQRLRCDACRTVQLWIPNFIRAGKYYDDRTIREAVEGSANSCPAEDSTIRRWKRDSSEVLQPDLPAFSSSDAVELKGTEKKGDKTP